MLENIFDNALRFSADKIVLTIGETKDYLSFAIQLSICKILCEKFGCVLHLENDPDHGAIVTVKIKKITGNFSEN